MASPIPRSLALMRCAPSDSGLCTAPCFALGRAQPACWLRTAHRGCADRAQPSRAGSRTVANNAHAPRTSVGCSQCSSPSVRRCRASARQLVRKPPSLAGFVACAAGADGAGAYSQGGEVLSLIQSVWFCAACSYPNGDQASRVIERVCWHASAKDPCDPPGGLALPQTCFMVACHGASVYYARLLVRALVFSNSECGCLCEKKSSHCSLDACTAGAKFQHTSHGRSAANKQALS